MAASGAPKNETVCMQYVTIYLRGLINALQLRLRLHTSVRVCNNVRTSG